MSKSAQFRTRCAGSPEPSAGTICPARSVWYRVQTGAARPASGRVCRALRGLPWFWHGLPCCLLCAGRPGALEWAGVHLRGIQEAPGVGWVDSLSRKNSKKAFFGVSLANTHPTFTKRNPSDCASLQKFRKIQKGPFRNLDCGIIS